MNQANSHCIQWDRYSCGHISGPHEPIHVKFGVLRVFHHVLLKYGNENAEMYKRKFDDVTLRYSYMKITFLCKDALWEDLNVFSDGCELNSANVYPSQRRPTSQQRHPNSLINTL